MSSFGALLLQLRLRSGRSGSSVARGAGIDASYLSRLERSEREPPRRDVVEALIRELQLDPSDGDQLLVAAGYPPRALARLGPDDPTIHLVASILANDAIPQGERSEFRQVIDILAKRWDLLPGAAERRAASVPIASAS